MKKIIVAISLLLGFLTLLSANNRYEVRSGIVKYKITTIGKSMGMSMDSNGQRMLYFKNWGNLELRDESISQNMMGSLETTRNMIKLDKENSYSVDFDNKVIIKTNFDELREKLNLIDKNVLESMDAEKTGTGRVLGYKCDIWSLMGSNIWVYKGVVLKSESSAMGMKTVETAISAKFNISISDKKFELPDFPVKTLQEMISGDRVDDSTEDESSSNIPSDIPSGEQMQEMMKKFSNMFGD